MSSYLIVYGTASGNTELAVERVGCLLSAAGHRAEWKRVEVSKPEELFRADVVILASPTYGHGLLYEYFYPFLEALKTVDLKGKPCAVIGLGDPKYDEQYHMESAVLLEEALKKAHGRVIVPALRISRSPLPFLETFIPLWVKNLCNAR